MNQLNRNSEKTQDKRWQLFAPVQIFHGTKTIYGMTKNISLSGLQVKTDFALFPEALITIEIFFEHPETDNWSESFIIPGEIMWVEEVDDELSNFEMGIMYHNLDKEKIEYLENEIIDLEEEL